MKRPSPFTNKRLLATAVMATWGMNVAIHQLVSESAQRSPASKEDSSKLDLSLEKSTHEKLEQLLAHWGPDQIVIFEQDLRTKAQLLMEKHGAKHQELQALVTARDLAKSEELKIKIVEFQTAITKDVSALEEQATALKLAQEQAKLMDADLNLQLKSTTPERLAEIQGDIQKIDSFSKIQLSHDLLTAAHATKKQVDELLTQVEVMEQQVTQLDENKKLQDEVRSNKETLETLRKELVELRCEKQRAIKLAPAEEQASFIKDINESAQKLALLERTAVENYPQLQAPIGMIYDHYNLGGSNTANLWSNNQMNSPFFQWQNMALMNSWMSQAMAPYNSPTLYSQYGIFDQNNNISAPGQSIYGNNNIVNYYLPNNLPGAAMGPEMGRAPSANIAAPATVNASGVGVQLGQSSLYQFHNFNGAPTNASSAFGFKF